LRVAGVPWLAQAQMREMLMQLLLCAEALLSQAALRHALASSLLLLVLLQALRVLLSHAQPQTQVLAQCAHCW
jgi:hypothetical protein